MPTRSYFVKEHHIEHTMAENGNICPVDQLTVGWICALPQEMTAAISMLDEKYTSPQSQEPQDPSHYEFGRIKSHKIVISCLPAGDCGTTPAATLANHMVRTFPSIKFGLLVGIGGGVPTSEDKMRLGDIVVSKPRDTFGGIVQCDRGKRTTAGKFIRTGSLNKPPRVLRNALSALEREQ